MRDLSEIAQPPELTDGRVRLRALRADDREAVVSALNDELAGLFLWRPPFPYTDADFEQFFAGNAERWQRDATANWVIADAADDTYLGSVSLDVIAIREGGELGYQLAPWARGRGACAAAVRLVRDWAFGDLALERLEITANTDNIASQRVAQAAGFTREGVLRGYLTARGERRDCVLFGMVPDDPRASAVPLPTPQLDDGFVELRPFQPSDAAAVAAACAAADIQHWIFSLPAPYTPADAEEFIGWSQQQLAAGRGAHCAVLDSASGELLGGIAMHVFPEFSDMAFGELGYWIAPEARRRGVALAAARLMVHWGFEEAGLQRVELLTYPGNQASQALAAKLGFTRLGLVRGYLPVETGKDRAGRYDAAAAEKAGLPAGAPPPRDDQVVFSLPRDERQLRAGGRR